MSQWMELMDRRRPNKQKNPFGHENGRYFWYGWWDPPKTTSPLDRGMIYMMPPLLATTEK